MGVAPEPGLTRIAVVEVGRAEHVAHDTNQIRQGVIANAMGVVKNRKGRAEGGRPARKGATRGGSTRWHRGGNATA